MDYEICENCYDEVSSVTKMNGMEICKECKKEMNSSSVAVLDNMDDMMGVASDDDIIGHYNGIANDTVAFDNEW